MSYDLTPRHVDLYGRVNGKGVYCHFVTGNNTSNLHFYQFCKKGETGNYHKVNTGYFCISTSNPFTQKLGLEAQFEISDVVVWR